MAFASHIVTVRRLKKYIDDVIGKKANLPDTSKTIIGNISQINSDLSDKMDSVPYGDDTLKFRFISGVFNPAETGGALYYNLTVTDAVAIIPMIAQPNSNLYLTAPTLTSNGWLSAINNIVDAQISWMAVVFYPSN